MMMAATRPKRRRSRAARRRTSTGKTPWALLLAGLALGGIIATASFYVRDKLAVRPRAAAASPKKPTPARQIREQAVPPEKDFGFYDMLPNSEVIIPEADQEGSRGGVPPAPISTPGVYVLQAGSFGSFAEADRAKARIALLGIGATIQRITVDGREFHRVRIGPLEDLDELNGIRRRLRAGSIDVIMIRVGE